MREVVDGEHRARVAVHAVGAVLGGEVHGRQRDVPVVGDKHAVLPKRPQPIFKVNQQRRLERSEREEAVAPPVVIVRTTLVGVEATWADVARVVHKDKIYALDILQAREEEDVQTSIVLEKGLSIPMPGKVGVLIAGSSSGEKLGCSSQGAVVGKSWGAHRREQLWEKGAQK